MTKLTPEAEDRIREIAHHVFSDAPSSTEREQEFRSHLAALAVEQAESAKQDTVGVDQIEKAYAQMGGLDAARAAFIARPSLATRRARLSRTGWFLAAVALAFGGVLAGLSAWNGGYVLLFLVGPVAVVMDAIYGQGRIAAAVSILTMAIVIGAFVGTGLQTNAELVFLSLPLVLGVVEVAIAYDVGGFSFLRPRPA